MSERINGGMHKGAGEGRARRGGVSETSRYKVMSRGENVLEAIILHTLYDILCLQFILHFGK